MQRSVNIDRIQEEVQLNKSSAVSDVGNLARVPNVVEEISTLNKASKMTVLLVDDEVQALRGLSRVLHKQPYNFFTVRSANEAMEVIQRQPIDVVVTDEQMTGMSGTELAAWIAQMYPNVKTIMLTGHGNIDVATRAINQGRIFKFFNKPCNASDLVLAIHEAIEEK